MPRGQLTRAVADKSRELIGREVTLTELRLIPYVQYCMLNEGYLEPRQINRDEREVLSQWREEGHLLAGGASKSVRLETTKAFWDFMNEMLWLAYAQPEG